MSKRSKRYPFTQRQKKGFVCVTMMVAKHFDQFKKILTHSIGRSLGCVSLRKICGHFKNGLSRMAFYFEKQSGQTKSWKNCKLAILFILFLKHKVTKWLPNRIVVISFLMY